MTISLRLDDDLSSRLAAVARAKGISKSDLIRRCITKALVEAEQESTAWEVGEKLFGCFKSGRGDLSVRAEEIARARVHAKRPRTTRR